MSCHDLDAEVDAAWREYDRTRPRKRPTPAQRRRARRLAWARRLAATVAALKHAHKGVRR